MKNLLYTILLTIICGMLYGQAPATTHNVSFVKPLDFLSFSPPEHKAYSASGTAITVDANENFYLASETNSDQNDDYRIAITKTEKNGEQLWTKTYGTLGGLFGTSSQFYPEDMATQMDMSTEQERIAVAGISDNYTAFMAPTYSAFLTVLDTAGAVQWYRDFDFSGIVSSPGEGYWIQGVRVITGDGGWVISVGLIKGSGGMTYTAMLDDHGSKKWDKYTGGYNDPSMMSICTLGGSVYTLISEIAPNHSSATAVIEARSLANGSMRWQKKLWTTHYSIYGFDILGDGDEISVLANYHDQRIVAPPIISLINMDTTGAVRRQHSYQPTATDIEAHGIAMKKLHNGNYAVLGNTRQYYHEVSLSSGWDDFIFGLVVSSDGSVQHTNQYQKHADVALISDAVLTSSGIGAACSVADSYGGPTKEWSAILHVDQNAWNSCDENTMEYKRLENGVTISTMDYDTPSYETSIRDFYVTWGDMGVEYDLCAQFLLSDDHYMAEVRESSADPLTEVSESLSVYPNPSHGAFAVAVPYSDQEVRLDLIDISGRLVDSRTVDGEQSVRYSDVPLGSYVLRMTSTTDIETQKIIVQY